MGLFIIEVMTSSGMFGVMNGVGYKTIHQVAFGSTKCPAKTMNKDIKDGLSKLKPGWYTTVTHKGIIERILRYKPDNVTLYDSDNYIIKEWDPDKHVNSNVGERNLGLEKGSLKLLNDECRSCIKKGKHPNCPFLQDSKEKFYAIKLEVK